MTTSKPYSQPGEKANKMSDEVIKLLENYGLALATDGKLGTNRKDSAAAVLAIIRTEKLNLLAAVRERVVGKDESLTGHELNPTKAISLSARNEQRTEQRAELTKLEAEL